MTDFLIWFYQGLGGLGGWLVFLLLGLAGLILIFAHSASRRIPAIGWKVIVLVAFLLILPAMVYRFIGQDIRSTLLNFTDEFFYLGLIAGIIPAILAIGYLVVYRGMLACDNGHIYDSRLGKCPECPPELVITKPEWSDEPAEDIYNTVQSNGMVSMESGRQKAAAWLVAEGGHTHQLYLDETTIGRISENDIKLNDTTVSKRHAKIKHDNGHFRLYDLGAKNHTRLNGRIIRKPMLIESEDEIQFGDNSNLIFKC